MPQSEPKKYFFYGLLVGAYITYCINQFGLKAIALILGSVLFIRYVPLILMIGAAWSFERMFIRGGSWRIEEGKLIEEEEKGTRLNTLNKAFWVVALLIIAAYVVSLSQTEGHHNETASQIRIGAICNDGTRSDATSAGACSSHEGVLRWIYRDSRPTEALQKPNTPLRSLAKVAGIFIVLQTLIGSGIYIWVLRKECQEDGTNLFEKL